MSTVTGGFAGAQRIDYAEGEWESGMPIFRRPGSHAQGNHIRPIVQTLPLPVHETCMCSDEARWPVPLWQHDLTNPRHIVPVVDYGGAA